MSVSGIIENIVRHHLSLYEEDFEAWRKLWELRSVTLDVDSWKAVVPTNAFWEGARLCFGNPKTPRSTMRAEIFCSRRSQKVGVQTVTVYRMTSIQKQNRKKGGRPPTGRIHKLSKSVTVKFSKPSYEALRLRARKANRKLAEYIRESALNGEVVSGHNAETVAIAKHLIGMANNLNQLAKLSHQTSQHGQSTLSYRV